MNKKIKLAVSTEIKPEHMEEIKKYYDVKILPWTATDYLPTEDDIIKECGGFEAISIYTDPITKRCVDELSKSGLKILSCGRATPNNVDWKALHENNIPLVYTPGRNAHAVAEYTVGLMLSICKRIAFTYNALQMGRFLAEEKEDIFEEPDRKDVIWRFKDRENPRSSFPWSIDVYGRTIGLVGFGAIGQNVGRICKGMGMRVLAYDPFQSDNVFEEIGAERVHWEEMLPQCDFVSVHLNVTNETRGMIDDKWFDSMREDAYFINTARAAVVNQKSLVKALEEKKIAFAALDVLWDEPAPKNYPLLHMDNVVITPHMGGICSDVKKWASEMIMEELLHYAKGESTVRVWKRLE